MDVVEIIAKKRDGSRAMDVRRNGMIPAECYGAGKENVSIQMDYQVFRKAYIVAGENTVIDLKVGDKPVQKVLVHQVDFNAVSDKIIHVDFVNVDMDVEVHTSIPLNFVGISPAVKDLAGMLMTNITDLEIKCLPGDLVHAIDVDITVLADFHTSIHVSDLIVPKKITVLADSELMVATVVAPRSEEEEVETEVPAEGEEVETEAPAEGGE
ncbi:MAG: 50S ribosomal protein L25 [Candidatus Peregrinibacteria bacterium]|nr:50S ribosomal protein L25 [Candidatus Peregrinibacteria bacterium]